MSEQPRLPGRMPPIPLDLNVLEGFGLQEPQKPPQILPGGEGSSYLIQPAGIVLKPAHDAKGAELLCNILSQIDNHNPNYRISRPLKAINGSFVYNGWTASEYIPDVRAPIKEKQEYTLRCFRWILDASRRFHAALRAVVLSDSEIEYLRRDDLHVWAHAHKVVWSDMKDAQAMLKPFAPEVARDPEHHDVKFLQRLVDLADRLGTAPAQNMLLYRNSSQIVHGDVVGGGNVLFPFHPPSSQQSDQEIQPIMFDSSLAPVIIDLSPTFGPPSYAEGILLADGLIWCQIGTEIMDLVGITAVNLDILRRGVMFRCLSDMGLVAGGRDSARPDIVEIERVTGLLEGMVDRLQMNEIGTEVVCSSEDSAGVSGSKK